MIRNRGEWNAAGAIFAPITDPTRVQFLTLHRIVTPLLTAHTRCLDWLQTEQLVAMDVGQPDIAWNAVCCPHGEVFDCLGVEQAPYLNDHIGEVERSVSLSLLVLSLDEDEPPPSRQTDPIQAYRLFYFGSFYPTAGFTTHRGWDGGSACPGDDWEAFVVEVESKQRREAAWKQEQQEL